MNLALAPLLCHYRIVDPVCSCCQSYNDAALVQVLLNVVLVVFIAGKNFYEVAKRTCAWKSRLNLSIERDKLGPRHDTDCKFRTPCQIVWGSLG